MTMLIDREPLHADAVPAWKNAEREQIRRELAQGADPVAVALAHNPFAGFKPEQLVIRLDLAQRFS